MFLTRVLLAAATGLALVPTPAAAVGQSRLVVLDRIPEPRDLRDMRVAFCLEGPGPDGKHTATAEALEPDDTPKGKRCAIAEVPDGLTGPGFGQAGAVRATSGGVEDLGQVETSDPAQLLRIPIGVCQENPATLVIVVPLIAPQLDATCPTGPIIE